jgi:hypothetical protein
VLVGLVAAVLHREPDHLDRARTELADDDAFTGARTAGEAFLRASVELLAAGEGCRPARDARCEQLFTAAALARVSSVQLLGCRRPDIHQYRGRFRNYLAALDDGGAVQPPPPPACD